MSITELDVSDFELLEDDTEFELYESLEVERIIQKRVIGRITEYYVKWRNYPEYSNTWETAENICNPELIEEYEDKLKSHKERAKRQLKIERDVEMREGFARGLIPQSIIGIGKQHNQVKYLMKWKDTDDADLVLAKDANLACPHLVIEYLEKNINFIKNE